MKKKIMIVLTFLVVLTLKEVSANEFAAYLPGGKNYLDPDNMVVLNNYFYTEDSMLVKANTEYTLSFPGFDIIGEDIYFELSGQDNYLIGDITTNEACDYDPSLITCTFTTSSNEDFLYFEFSAPMLSLYIDYYDFESFQLEEGPLSTSYEEYIAPFIDTTTPEFSGTGAYITSYQTNELIETIVSNHIMAIDDIDGDLSDQIIIVSDEYTSNEQIVGEYDVLLSVSDSANNETLFNLTIMVKDEIDPIIIGPSMVTVPIDAPPTIQSIIDANFTLTDEYDSSVEGYTTADDYTSNNTVIGEYSVTYEISDDSLNTDSITFTVKVVDTVSPEMAGNNVYNSYLSNSLSYSDIFNSISFTDNYTDLTGVEPTIITDGFSGNENIPGTYYINIEIDDSSGNTLSETLTINVIDDIAPSIGGPISYSGSYGVGLLLSDFLDMLSASDNIDSLTNSDIYVISDTYTDRTTEIGDFIIVFGVMDSNNNEYTHQIDITLFDGVAPVIYVDNYIITVDLSATFNEQDALRLLLNSNELENGNYTVTRLLDEYTGNEENPGAYIYRLSFTNDAGEVFEKEFLVKVADSNKITFDKDLLSRNIAVYSSIFGFFTFVIVKRKKISII